MALINCKECGREVSDTANNCLHCGYVLQQYSFPASLSMDGDIGKQIVNWAYNAALTGKVKPTEENQHLVGNGVGNRLLVLHKNGISIAGSKFRLHYQQVEKIKMVSDGLLIRFWDLENQDLRSVVIDGDKNVIKMFLARYQKESSKPNNPAQSSSVSKKGGCLKWFLYIFGGLTAMAVLGHIIGPPPEQKKVISTPTSQKNVPPVKQKQSVSEICGFTISEITMRGTDLYYNVSGYDATSIADATCLKNFILNNNRPTQGLTVHFMDNMPDFRPQGTGMYGSTSAMKKVILQCVTIGDKFEFYFDPLGYGTFAQPQ